MANKTWSACWLKSKKENFPQEKCMKNPSTKSFLLIGPMKCHGNYLTNPRLLQIVYSRFGPKCSLNAPGGEPPAAAGVGEYPQADERFFPVWFHPLWLHPSGGLWITKLPLITTYCTKVCQHSWSWHHQGMCCLLCTRWMRCGFSANRYQRVSLTH